jgi:hypothetical protein
LGEETVHGVLEKDEQPVVLRMLDMQDIAEDFAYL